MKLTPAQRKLLERLATGATLSYDKLHGSIWSNDGRFTVKVNPNTFNALSLKTLIGAWSTEGNTTGYRITPAGRAALNPDEG